jgi:glyceraldehyde 3-phosphate dehydrogenase
MRVAINGFGRIGRTLLRQILTDPAHADIEVAAINDITPLDSCAYLFRYDSVFGPFPTSIETSDALLRVTGRVIPFLNAADISTVDLSGVDVLLDCTGTAGTREMAERGLVAHARNVLISGPSDAADVTAVLGANEDIVGDVRIVSNASCTTNAIAPLLKRLDEALGIEHAHITTIHCYTGSQPTVDAPTASFERSRAAAVSMVPTSTSAASQIGHILPELADRISVAAVRVPCISVSAIDAVVQLKSAPPEDLNSFLRNTFGNGPWIRVTDDPCVSTDMRARPESLVLAIRETQRVGDRQLRLFGWYDNEWGFSARMIDMARRLAERP